MKIATRRKPKPHAGFEEQYRSSLREYAAGGGEPALGKAYELGRRALSEQKSLVEMASLHHQAVLALVGGAIAAVPVATDPATASIAVRTASHPIRIALTTVSTPPRRCKPEALTFRISNMPYSALSKRIINCASRDRYLHVTRIAAAHAEIMH